MRFLRLIFIIGLLSFAVACGSSSDNSGKENGIDSDDVGNEGNSSVSDDDIITNANLIQGNFLDSAVEGLQYKSGSHTGITDTGGTFSYEDKKGQVISFFVGDIAIGEAGAVPLLTPVNLFSAAGTDPTGTTVTNIARFLQTIDNDNNPANGITINEAVRDKAAGMSVNFEQDIASFESDNNIQTVIAELTALTESGQRPLIPSQDAQAHLHNTLMSLYSGIYSGTFSGDHSGIWTIKVYSGGNIIGSGVNSADESTFDIWGSISNQGVLSLYANGAIFNNTPFIGSVDLYKYTAGSWSDSDDGIMGEFSGTKTGELSGDPRLVILGYYSGLITEVAGCSAFSSSSVISNIQYDTYGRRMGYDQEITFENGHCKGQTYSLSVHDITYTTWSYMGGAQYDVDGITYDALFIPTVFWP